MSETPAPRPHQDAHIIVDWGTSNFRAYRFGADGAIVDRHQAEAGILTIRDGAFEEVLEQQIGRWFGAGTSIMLSGMITSRNGWVETPYVPTPATLQALSAQAVVRTSTRGATLKFLPGVAAYGASPDVMRGEEIQVFGTVAAGDTATVVLPGTHSKWTQVQDGTITGFRTFLTGETFALLKTHSIVGRLIPQGAQSFDEATFRAGVRMAQGAGSISLLNDIFTARSGALLGSFAVEEIADRLSGMLLGHEIKAGLSLRVGKQLVLVGEEALTTRYRMALEEFGQSADIGPTHATVEGFRRLAALERGAA